ncbi:uncharacterized protein LOC101855161 [Aplysia californica]|uniref:Glycosyltransferase family 92 protein n=1 Tax=Aplysia californica TaxID=6500 RepID=A0ABM1AE34_APLCA|nr:uncharacterized protein LOC101855161 [Aplysia californica]
MGVMETAVAQIQNRSHAKKASEKDARPFYHVPDSEIYVYSVFYETFKPEMGSPGVRAIGVGPRKGNYSKVFCHVVSEDETKKRFDGRLFALNSYPYHKYVAVSIDCPVPQDTRPKLSAFSLLRTSERSNYFPVIYPGKVKERNFTVCGATLFGFRNHQMLLQSVVYNRLMGAGHQYVYNQTIGPKVDALLRHFQDLGLVTVLPMPSFPGDRAWYHGQIVAITDCIYRNRYTSEFVAVQDLDEFLLPLKHRTWGELITATLGAEVKAGRKPQDVAGFVFQHSFYCVGESDDNVARWMALKKSLSVSDEDEKFIKDVSGSLFLNWMRQKLLSYPQRVKTIYRPEFAREPGIHFPIKLWSGKRHVKINPAMGMLAHHRMRGKCTIKGEPLLMLRQYLDALKNASRDFQAYLTKTHQSFSVPTPPAPVNSPKMNSPKMNSPKMNSPKKTSPKMSSPEMTSPKMNSPKTTSSKMNSPKTTSPKMNSPKMNSPKKTSPKMSSPEMNSPKTTSSEMTSPEMTSPKMTSPEMTSHKMTSPKMTSPKRTSPKTTSSEMTSPEMTSPEMNSPEMTSPKMTSPKMTSPKITSPKRTSPKHTNITTSSSSSSTSST